MASHDLVTQVVRDLGDGDVMVTKFVVVAEVILPETGRRDVWIVTDDDAQPWDTAGLLVYAMNDEATE